jgi:predicted transcriptional regulator
VYRAAVTLWPYLSDLPARINLRQIATDTGTNRNLLYTYLETLCRAGVIKKSHPRRYNRGAKTIVEVGTKSSGKFLPMSLDEAAGALATPDITKVELTQLEYNITSVIWAALSASPAKLDANHIANANNWNFSTFRLVLRKLNKLGVVRRTDRATYQRGDSPFAFYIKGGGEQPLVQGTTDGVVFPSVPPTKLNDAILLLEERLNKIRDTRAELEAKEAEMARHLQTLLEARGLLTKIR